MKYTFNGKQITKNEAIEKIYNAVPNGGLKYVEELVADAKDEGLHSITVMVGNFPIGIIF